MPLLQVGPALRTMDPEWQDQLIGHDWALGPPKGAFGCRTALTLANTMPQPTQ